MQTMRSLWILAGVALSYVLGAALLGLQLHSTPAWFSKLASLEIVHVVAHSLLYGGLWLTVVRLGLGPRRAAAVVMGVAIAQELAQDLVFRRWPGFPELFDLCVDAGAMLLAASLKVMLDRSSMKALLQPE